MTLKEYLLGEFDGLKIISGAQRIVNDQSFRFTYNQIWAAYAAQETNVLRNPNLLTEEREAQALALRQKRFALEDLLNELEDISNTPVEEESDEESEDNGENEE